MNVSYHVATDGMAYISRGTPHPLGLRENINLIFDVPCDSAAVYFNRRRVDAPNGIAVIFNDKIKAANEIKLQYTKDRVTYTVICEGLELRDGILHGDREGIDTYPGLKQTVVNLEARCDYLTKKVSELADRCAKLERQVSGPTNIFNV